MKAIGLIFTLNILLFVWSCTHKPKSTDKNNARVSISWEWNGKDTINRTVGGMKKGNWEESDYIASDKTIHAVYTGEQGVQTKILKNDVEKLKIAAGEYVDGKREGLWKFYYPSGRLKDSAVYKNGEIVK